MTNYQLKRLDINEIDLIRPLWEKLNLTHMDLSTHFRKRFQEANWEKRKTKLIEKSEELLLETVVEKNLIIGYCISSINKGNNKMGEIDSIYIDENHRKCGLGKLLINHAVDWLISKGTTEQKLLVGVGNERVLDFYKQLNFMPLHIVLQRIDKDEK